MAKRKFPRNYRIIPETIKRINDEIFILVGLFCILIAILTVQSDLYSNLQHKNMLSSEKTKVSKEIKFWQNQIIKHPDYRDAYLYLGILNYQLGNELEAQNNFDKAILIDPNYERKSEFEAILK